MRWRSLLFLLLWVIVVLVLLFPSICGDSLTCSTLRIPVVVALGIVAVCLVAFDAREVRRQAREKLRGQGGSVQEPENGASFNGNDE